MRILAISGSLRAASSNTALLRAAAALAPEGMEVVLYGGLGDLPHFNPDLEGAAPPAVIDLWARVREADGLLIACPEYAHGVPGAMKNALDWLVGGDEFIRAEDAALYGV
jgi:chromate reductase